jgi:hypothetical protein
MNDKKTYAGELVERDLARRQHKRDRARLYWLEIYLPVLAGVLVVAGLVYLIWRVGFGSASAWADASLVFLLPLVMLCGLIPLLLLGALVVAMAFLTPKLPEPMQRAREFMEMVSGRVRTWSYRIERPFIRGRQFRRSARRMFPGQDEPDQDTER